MFVVLGFCKRREEKKKRERERKEEGEELEGHLVCLII